MHPALTIRSAIPDDLPAIVAIYNSTIASRMVTADTEPVSVESKRHWFDQHNEKRPLWVAEHDGEIVAWISFQSFYGRPAYQATVEISIYLHEQSRGKGLGKYLLQYSIRKARDFNVKTILGFIFAHNIPSIKLFESSGFQQWGHMPDIAEMDGIERSLAIYGLRIG